jgi:hypothetical protein
LIDEGLEVVESVVAGSSHFAPCFAITWSLILAYVAEGIIFFVTNSFFAL